MPRRSKVIKSLMSLMPCQAMRSLKKTWRLKMMVRHRAIKNL
ncbi:Uncharacterised protein [Vibrio cholerae]|nr:Uncharacterised protein [Vibrio cholerae]